MTPQKTRLQTRLDRLDKMESSLNLTELEPAQKSLEAEYEHFLNASTNLANIHIRNHQTMKAERLEEERNLIISPHYLRVISNFQTPSSPTSGHLE